MSNSGSYLEAASHGTLPSPATNSVYYYSASTLKKKSEIGNSSFCVSNKWRIVFAIVHVGRSSLPTEEKALIFGQWLGVVALKSKWSQYGQTISSRYGLFPNYLLFAHSTDYMEHWYCFKEIYSNPILLPPTTVAQRDGRNPGTCHKTLPNHIGHLCNRNATPHACLWGEMVNVQLTNCFIIA